MKSMIIFVLFLLAISGCNLSNSTDSMDVWENRTCCDQKEHLFIDDLSYVRALGINIKHCVNLHENSRINLFKKNNSSYETLCDIKSFSDDPHDTIILGGKCPENFNGQYSACDSLPDGLYKLYISTGFACGSINFTIKNKELISKEFRCIKSCP
jgi:hypothetical protein